MPRRTGIDISPSIVTAAQIRIDRSGWSLLAGAQMARSSDEPVLQPEEAERLESLLFRKGFTPAPCVINASSEALTSSILELPPMRSGAPIDKLARAEFSRRSNIDPNDFVLSYWELPTQGPGHQVMAVACLVEPTDARIAALESAGLQVAGVDDPSRAMSRVLSCAPVTTTVCVGARVEPWGSSIVVLHHGTVLYARTPVGLALSPDPDEHGDLATRLAQEIDACVSFARHRSRSHAPATVSILGEGGRSEKLMDAITRRFGDAIGHPVTPAGERIDPALAPAVGLALLEDIA